MLGIICVTFHNGFLKSDFHTDMFLMTPHGSQCLKINLKVSFYSIYFRKQKLPNKSRLAIEYLRYLILFWLIFKVCDIMISKIIVSLSFHFIILLFLMHRVMILKPEEEEC